MAKRGPKGKSVPVIEAEPAGPRPEGRPEKPINWSDVDKLCGLQCLEVEIAFFCDVSVDTLNRRCRSEKGMSFAEYFEVKRQSGKISIRRLQFQAAQKGNVGMLIWLGKQLLGQRERSFEEVEADARMQWIAQGQKIIEIEDKRVTELLDLSKPTDIDAEDDAE